MGEKLKENGLISSGNQKSMENGLLEIKFVEDSLAQFMTQVHNWTKSYWIMRDRFLKIKCKEV